jgi:hypothetical protein
LAVVFGRSFVGGRFCAVIFGWSFLAVVFALAVLLFWYAKSGR